MADITPTFPLKLVFELPGKPNAAMPPMIVGVFDTGMIAELTFSPDRKFLHYRYLQVRPLTEPDPTVY